MERLLAFEDEYARLAPTRERFWQLLEEAYAVWQEQDRSIPETLDELIDAVRFPEGLPLPEGQSLMTWVDEVPPYWIGPTAKLWLLASYIYPWQRDPHAPTVESPLMDRATHREFHTARRQLAKFWDRCGREILVQRSIPAKTVEAYIPREVRLIKMLTYLECALVHRTLDGGPGRQWMFALGPLLHGRKAPPRKVKAAKEFRAASAVEKESGSPWGGSIRSFARKARSHRSG
ncbi:MAG: hypothetical protein V3V17_04715 [Alphaproteobacteria bacterium]